MGAEFYEANYTQVFLKISICPLTQSIRTKNKFPNKLIFSVLSYFLTYDSFML